MRMQTDKKAALALAQLHASGMLTGVWIPPHEVRDLRALITRVEKELRNGRPGCTPVFYFDENSPINVPRLPKSYLRVNPSPVRSPETLNLGRVYSPNPRVTPRFLQMKF
jgi:hypothetical protein